MNQIAATLPTNGNTNGNLVALNGSLNNNSINMNNLNNNNLIDEDKEMIDEETPEVDINISNVVCNFSTRCHLNLRQIAMNGANVEYKREQGVCINVNLKLLIK